MTNITERKQNWRNTFLTSSITSFENCQDRDKWQRPFGWVFHKAVGWSKISNIRNSYGPLQIIILWVKSNTQKNFYENRTSFRYAYLWSKFYYILRQCAPIWNGGTKKIRIFSNFSFQKKLFWIWVLYEKCFLLRYIMLM